MTTVASHDVHQGIILTILVSIQVISIAAVGFSPVVLNFTVELSDGINVCGDCATRYGFDVTPNYFCCEGWTNGTIDGLSCLTPVCHTPCGEHGTCTSPNVCTCLPGYIGEFCDFESHNSFDTRLLHGKEPHQGLLQVRSQDGEWNFIYPENWSRNNSHVVCQQLGYSFAVVQSDGDWSDFPEASYPFLQLQFRCVGNEDALQDCVVVRVQGEAEERQMVAIECYDPTQDQTDTCGLTCDQETVSRTGCKCDPFCESYGDCCPYYFSNGNCLQGIAAQVEETCSPLPLHHSLPFNVRKTIDVGYFFISDCSDSWYSTYDDVTSLCRNKPNATDPLSFTPVQELISKGPSKKIYLNIFCAICNFREIRELQSWNILVREDSFEEMSPVIYNIVPPYNETAPRTCLLNLKSVSTCMYRHRSIYDRCSNYYQPWFNRTNGFQNIFCAVCNDEFPQYKQLDTRLNIPVIRSQPYAHCLIDLENGVSWWNNVVVVVTVPDLVTIFNFGNGNHESECDNGEIYDYFSQSCRLLSCPSGFALSNGLCEEIVLLPLHALETEPVVSDKTLEECVSNVLKSRFEIESALANATDPIYTTKITFNSDTVVVHVNSTSFASSVISINNILASKQINNSKGEKFCNTSSFLVWLEDGSATSNRNTTNISCIHSEQLGGCISKDHDLDLINTAITARIFEYVWENDTDCYGLRVTWDDCNALNQPIVPCPEIELASYEFEIILTSDNTTTVLHKASGNKLSDDEFRIGENGTVRVCASVFDPDPNKLSKLEEALTYVSFGCLILSLAATFLTFLSYCVFRELRNLTGYIVINLLIAFFVAQLVFLLSPRLLTPTEICLTSAVISHFAWLAGFFWMNALSFVTTNTLSRSTMVRDKSMEACRLIRYMAYAWGGPLLIVGVCISLHFCNCTEIAPIYGEKNGALCWLIGHDDYANLWGFTAPVLVLLLFNVVLFIYAVATFRKKMASAKSKITSNRMKMEISIYVKLTILMGLPWLLGFVLIFERNIYLNYIYTVLNSLQGVFIFWALVLTGRAGKLWRNKLCRSRRTLKPTGRSSKPGTNSSGKTATTSFTTSSTSK